MQHFLYNSFSAFFSHPLVVAVVSVVVRLLLAYNAISVTELLGWSSVTHPTETALLDSLNLPHTKGVPVMSGYRSANGETIVSPSPLHFATILLHTESAGWREAAFYRDTLRQPVPHYLIAHIPWYALYIPGSLARWPGSVIALAVCDGLTAYLVAGWPSTITLLLYAIFVLNPLLIAPSLYESLMPLEFLLIAVVLQASYRRTQPGVGTAARLLCSGVALLAAFALGSPFLALAVAVVAPVGSPSAQHALFSTALLILATGVYAVLYVHYIDTARCATSLHARVDNGVLWYVRQVVMPPFALSLDIFFVQFPAVVTLIVAVVMPAARPLAAKREVLYPQPRLFVLVFAVGISVLLRMTLTASAVCYAAMLFYSFLNHKAVLKTTPPSDDVTKEAKVREYSAYNRASMLVPAYFMVITFPLMIGFYTRYVLWEVSNPNFFFFSGVAFLLGCFSFLAFWLQAVTEDYVDAEREEVRGIAT